MEVTCSRLEEVVVAVAWREVHQMTSYSMGWSAIGAVRLGPPRMAKAYYTAMGDFPAFAEDHRYHGMRAPT